MLVLGRGFFQIVNYTAFFAFLWLVDIIFLKILDLLPIASIRSPNKFINKVQLLFLALTMPK